jgi:hypothetical protein
VNEIVEEKRNIPVVRDSSSEALSTLDERNKGFFAVAPGSLRDPTELHFCKHCSRQDDRLSKNRACIPYETGP